MLQEFHVRINRCAVGIEQKKSTFWVAVASHYARNKPVVGPERPARSLETKWGDLKVSIAKLVGCYEHIKALDESGRTDDDIIVDDDIMGGHSPTNTVGCCSEITRALLPSSGL